MRIRDPIAVLLACFAGSCSSGGSAKIVDAHTPDGTRVVDGGPGRDSPIVAYWDGTTAVVDQAQDSAEADAIGTDGAADAPVAAPDIATEAADAGRDASALDRPIGTALDVGQAMDSTDAAADRALDAGIDAQIETDAAGPLDVAEANNYYVSPSGNDAAGDGSAAHPWKTISAATSRIDYSRGLPTLNIAAGTYDEKVVLHDSIVLRGAGSGKVTVKNSTAGDTDYVVTADGSNPTVPGAVAITMTGLRVDGLAAKNRGICANQATIKLDDVNVYQPSAYGISIGTNITGFAIDHTTVGFEGMLYSDVGIDVGSGSSGTISHFTGGDHIDHIINIGLGCTVDISDSQLTGSPIWYADGVRIQGASNVTVRNTTILRPSGSQPASAGPVHNPPYAGIEVAASSNGNATVRIDGCTVRGFDVGVGVNLMYNRLLVQNNTIAQNTSADVRTLWSGTSPTVYPVVDLGGGALGSVGNNDFGNGTEYAVDLGGPYDVAAKQNLWSGTAIEARIHDQLDDPLLGRVQY
jgi:hypothetical protein